MTNCNNHDSRLLYGLRSLLLLCGSPAFGESNAWLVRSHDQEETSWPCTFNLPVPLLRTRPFEALALRFKQGILDAEHLSSLPRQAKGDSEHLWILHWLLRLQLEKFHGFHSSLPCAFPDPCTRHLI